MFKKRTLGQEMAFGTVPAYCRYELFMERYRSAAEIAWPEIGDREIRALDVGSGPGLLKRFFNFGNRIQWDGLEMNENDSRCSIRGAHAGSAAEGPPAGRPFIRGSVVLLHPFRDVHRKRPTGSPPYHLIDYRAGQPEERGDLFDGVAGNSAAQNMACRYSTTLPKGRRYR